MHSARASFCSNASTMPIVSFMPFFPDERVDHVVGDFRVWNWATHRGRADDASGTYLERYFNLFVTSDGAPERRIAILSEANGNLFPDEAAFRGQEILRLAAALMACFLFRFPTGQDAGWAACSSDNFATFHQPFDAAGQNPGVGFEFGSYVRVRVVGSWEHMRFATPQYIPRPTGCEFNNDMLNRLAGLFASQDLGTERIFRSFDWLRPAFANYDLEYRSRVIAMATAFEILLGLPDHQKAAFFANRVNELLPPNCLPTSARPWGPRNVQTTDNEVGWWCRTFYDLRSRIVHGDAVPVTDFHFSPGVEHLQIALSLFEECVRGLLIEMGRMREAEREQYLLFEHPWRDKLGLPGNVWY